MLFIKHISQRSLYYSHIGTTIDPEAMNFMILVECFMSILIIHLVFLEYKRERKDFLRHNKNSKFEQKM